MTTVETRFNGVPRDQGNCSLYRLLDISKLGKKPKCSLYRSIVNNCFSLIVLIIKTLITLVRDKEDVDVLIVSVSVKLFYWMKRFSSLLACFVFVFCHLMTFLRYIRVYYTFGLLDYIALNCNFGQVGRISSAILMTLSYTGRGSLKICIKINMIKVSF